MVRLGDLMLAIERTLFAWLCVFAILTTLELASSRGEQSLRQRAGGLAFWMVSIPISAILLYGWAALWARIGWTPLLQRPALAAVAGLSVVGPIAGVVLAAAINDFFYWFHRAQHRWLWRYHAVHHSIENLSAVNSNHHVSEVLMSMAMMTVPISLIVGDVMSALPFAGFVLWLHIVYIHSPTRVHLGPLRAVFADNRFHRIHHSLEKRHFDRNFGAFTTLWDRLFGTAHMPAKDEWPAVGLAESREPRTIAEWHSLPARYAKATRGVPAIDTDRPAVTAYAGPERASRRPTSPAA